MSKSPVPLVGRRVGVTADRRWHQQAELLRRLGAEVVHGPTIRTMDLTRDESLRRATLDLVARPPQHLVATTGMGIAMWLEAAAGWDLAEPLVAALRRSTVVARGAKATSVLRRHGFGVSWVAPDETMEEIVEHLRAEGVGDDRVAIQLFDPGEHPATLALRGLCRDLVEVPVYRWLLPEDPGPAERLVDAVLAGGIDAVTFTSQPAVHQLFRIAARAGREDDLRDAFNRGVLAACVGAVCAEAARNEGIKRPAWPDPPRLPALVALVASELGAV